MRDPQIWILPLSLILTGVAGVAVSPVVGPVLIWGGTECAATGGIELCVGYPPTGIVVIAIAVTLLVSVVIIPAAKRLASLTPP